MPTTSTEVSLKPLLAELVQMPTITAEKATSKAAIDWFKYQVRDLPLHIHDFMHNGYASVIFTTQPTKHPKVLLHAHVDVAPAPEPLFGVTERSGRLYGRGVFDMKVAVAAYLKLLLELGEDLPQYDFGISLTTDEEATGGMYGVVPILEAGWSTDVVLNPDSIESGLHWAIQTAAKGTARFSVHAKGIASHGSRPWLGRNAIDELMTYLRELETHFPSEPCGDPRHGHQTVNIGVISGGKVFNQVPDSAEADVNIRFMPDHTKDEMEALLREVKVPYERLSIKTLNYDSAVSISPHHKQVKRLHAIISDVTGEAPHFVLSHGSSESSHFTERGIPVLMFGAPGGGHHSDDEWVDARGAEQFSQVITEFVEQAARSSSPKAW
jgi:succinyl-diaminopimelate desuccinylase